LSNKVELANGSVRPEAQDLVLLQTLKALLNAVIGALSRGEPGSLAEISRDINATAADVLANSLNLARVQLTPEAQRQRQKLLAEIRRQRSFCLAMLRRWRRSILLRQQLLGLATEAAIYPEPIASPRVSA
jgi:hypothetical protein